MLNTYLKEKKIFVYLIIAYHLDIVYHLPDALTRNDRTVPVCQIL